MNIEPEKIVFNSSVDGKEDYFMLHRAGKDCLVWLHGHGSHGEQPFTRKDVVEFLWPLLEKYNLSVISPNLRDNAWMSPAAVADLAGILTDAKKEYGFERFIFLCGSMGGTGALIFAAYHPELVDRLGIMGAATDIGRYREFCRTGNHPVHEQLYQAITENYSETDYIRHNVCNMAEKLTMPLCFYHGESDPVMPVSEMTELQKLMPEGAKAVFRSVPGEHDAPLAYMNEILSFLI